jgi:hypothetical protein
MVKVLIALVLLAGSASLSAYAAGVDEAKCRAAIRERKPCTGNRYASPQLAACFNAALARCKAKGVGAI